MNIAIIPARGGSKRILRKNIKDFIGKPVIAWSIQAAKKSGLFDMVIVSTDDKEIADIARKYGAEVPFMRPDVLSDDFTPTNEVIKHALVWLRKEDYPIEHVCCIYACAPFVQPEYLEEGYHKLVNSGKSYSFSVTTFPFPIQRAIRINQQGYVEAIWPENINSRSQDLEERYHDAGQFYWGTVNAFLENKIIFSQDSIPVILPRYLVQDIDTDEDWKRAEIMFKTLIQSDEIVI